MTKSLDCNEVLPKGNMELGTCYQTKLKKIDEEIVSHLNELSKNNKDAVKN